MTTTRKTLTGALAAAVAVCLGMSGQAYAKAASEKQSLGSLAADPVACPDGSFLNLDARGSGEWLCLNAQEMRAALGFSNLVFTTSGIYTGDLVTEAQMIDAGFTGTGLQAGDFICNYHAAEAGLPGEYAAWLSDSVVNAVDRLTPGSGPFVSTSGDLVAVDIEDLTDGEILSGLGADEGGALVEASPVWTGTLQFGVVDPRGATCRGDWSSALGGDIGLAGVSQNTDAGWTATVLVWCSESWHLYCFMK